MLTSLPHELEPLSRGPGRRCAPTGAANFGDLIAFAERNARQSGNFWTLDKRGLDGLLIFDARRPKLDGTAQVLLGGPRRPLTVAQRLTLEHQLARVEFLARIGLRVSP